MTSLLTRNLYGKRPDVRLDVYRIAPGWWFVYLLGWTFEFDAPQWLERALVAMLGDRACADLKGIR